MSWIIVALGAWSALTLLAVSLAASAGRADRRAAAVTPAAPREPIAPRFEPAEQRPRLTA